jgi:peptidylprolyl isomerase
MLRKLLIMMGLAVPLAASAQVSEPQSSMPQDVVPYQVTTPSGLQYTDVKVGTGATPQVGQLVTVHYVGKLTNGDKFDSSRDRGQPFSFHIGEGEVIKGWDEGVMGMRVGGIRELKIPADLGYGDRGAPPVIPPNATLLFTVELLGVR